MCWWYWWHIPPCFLVSKPCQIFPGVQTFSRKSLPWNSSQKPTLWIACLFHPVGITCVRTLFFLVRRKNLVMFQILRNCLFHFFESQKIMCWFALNFVNGPCPLLVVAYVLRGIIYPLTLLTEWDAWGSWKCQCCGPRILNFMSHSWKWLGEKQTSVS